MEKNMTLEEVRCQIDSIDAEIRELIMKRLDCSRNVAMAKQASGNLVIYRADREAEILERLSQGVPEDRKAEYLAVVKKIMETSRMYQYGLLYDWNEGLFDPLTGTTDYSQNVSGKSTFPLKLPISALLSPDRISQIRWLKFFQ